MTIRFAILLLLAGLPGLQAAEHWLLPLWTAAEEWIRDDPEIQHASLAEQRARLGQRQEEAAWNPRLHAESGIQEGSQDIRAPSSPEPRLLRDYEVAAQVAMGREPQWLVLPGMQEFFPAGQRSQQISQSAFAEVGLQQRWQGGRSATLSLRNTYEQDRRPAYTRSSSWISRLRLQLSQELLAGSSRAADRASLADAQSLLEQQQDDLEQALMDAFHRLAEDWLQLGRQQAAWDHAHTALESARSDLALSQARFEAGLANRSEILTRERDVVEQEAQVRRLERATTAAQEQLRISWGHRQLPPAPSMQEGSSLLPAAPDFAQTPAGRRATRAQERAQRAQELAQDRGRDRLSLAVNASLSGDQDAWARSWQNMAQAQRAEWGLQLRYERVIGGSRERYESERARLALRQASLAEQATERDWLLRLDALQRNWRDALENIQERRASAQAIREERDLIAAEFAEGNTSIRELIRAENSLRNAEQAIITALYQTFEAELRFRAHINALKRSDLLSTPRSAP